MTTETKEAKHSAMTLQDAIDEHEDVKNEPTPPNEPSETLNETQKEFMENHKQSELHNEFMECSMKKKGMCVERAHESSHEMVGE